jgi:hypothetical protein
MEKAADALPIEQVAKRWIVAFDPDEAVERAANTSSTASTIWSSTLPGATSAASSICSIAIWNQGCASWVDPATERPGVGRPVMR